MFKLFQVGESDILIRCKLCGLKFDIEIFKHDMDLPQQKLSMTYNDLKSWDAFPSFSLKLQCGIPENPEKEKG